MKKTFLTGVILLCCAIVKAETNASITVGGDLDKFYPVTFVDGNWGYSRATELEIGRSDIHTNSDWRGAFTAKFRYHTTNWGHGAQFIDADIKVSYAGISATRNFIGGWKDVSGLNGEKRIVIWLRGGQTTYTYTSGVDVNPVVYDGVQNALPFHEVNGPDHTYKTIADDYVNENGFNLSGHLTLAGIIRMNGGNTIFSDVNNIGFFSNGGFVFANKDNSYTKAAFSNAGALYLNGNSTWNVLINPLGDSYINGGNLSIGTTVSNGYKLSVDGTIRTKKVVVTQAGWADYVFAPSYQLPSLDSVAAFIETNKHLPGIPSEAEVKKDGHDVGEMQKLLLQKVEEMTLYMIDLKKQNTLLLEKNEQLEKRIQKIESKK